MSNYFSYDELIGKYPDCAKDRDANVVGSFWIPGVQARIDALFANLGYTAPFTPFVPPLVKDIAIDLCYWRMSYREENQDILKEDIDARLAGIADRSLQLTYVDSSGSVVTLQPPSQVFLSNSYGSSFGMDSDVRFRVDSSWQIDNANARGDGPFF